MNQTQAHICLSDWSTIGYYIQKTSWSWIWIKLRCWLLPPLNRDISPQSLQMVQNSALFQVTRVERLLRVMGGWDPSVDWMGIRIGQLLPAPPVPSKVTGFGLKLDQKSSLPISPFKYLIQRVWNNGSCSRHKSKSDFVPSLGTFSIVWKGIASQFGPGNMQTLW